MIIPGEFIFMGHVTSEIVVYGSAADTNPLERGIKEGDNPVQ